MTVTPDMPLAEQLHVKCEQAKAGAMFPQRNFHYLHGCVEMAYELGALTRDEYLQLSHEIIAEGINNPAYFKVEVQ